MNKALIFSLMMVSVNVIAGERLIMQSENVRYSDNDEVQIERMLVDNGDNTYALIPGQRSEELKQLHQEVCDSVGGKDVTDTGSINLVGSAVDAVVCEVQRVVSNSKSQDIEAFSGSYVEIYPPNQQVQVGYNFHLRGSFAYYSAQSGNYQAQMTSHKCGIQRSSGVGVGYSSTIQMLVLCHAFDPGVYSSYLQAQIPGAYGSGYGTVTAQ